MKEEGRVLPRIRKISRAIFLPERVARRASCNGNERERERTPVTEEGVEMAEKKNAIRKVLLRFP